MRKRLKKVVNGRSLVLQSHERMAVSDANVHLDTLASQNGSEEEDGCEDDVTSTSLDPKDGCEGDVTSTALGPKDGCEGGVTSTAFNPKEASELIARAQAIPQVIKDLTELNQHLGDMFTEHFGLDAVLRNYEAPTVYRAFFIQACLQLLHS